MSAGLRAHLDGVRRLPPDYWWHRHRYALALAALPRGARSALDYGCGDGGFARFLAARAPWLEVRAWDADPDARAALAASARLLEPGAAFDFVSALDVLEHCADDAAEARRLASLLAPGGTLFVTVPAGPGLWSRWDEELGHVRRYDRAGLRVLLEGAGLRVARCTPFFSYLVPAALRRARRSGPGVEFPRLGRAANAGLRALGACERACLKAADLRFGTSLFAVATRPA